MKTTGKYITKIGVDQGTLWQDKSPMLTSLDIELTERCNNNCIHCYINLPPHDADAANRELGTDEIRGILEEAASLGLLSVRFSGGEPLLREDFRDIYIFARKLGLKVTLFTNGTLITPDIAELFTCIPPLNKIEVTLYGMSKDTCESVTRIPGSFEAAFAGIDLLIEKQVPFIVKGTPIRHNKKDIEALDRWAGRIPWMEKSVSLVTSLYLRARHDSEKKNETIRKLRLPPDKSVGLVCRDEKKYFDELRLFASRFLKPAGNRLFSCGAGCGGGCIDAYGVFQLCMLLRHPETVYDLKTGSLKEAINDFFPKIREKEAASSSEYPNRCALCFIKSLCGQCPGNAWMEHGTLDTPVDYLCDIAHWRAVHCGILDYGEKAWQVRNWQERIQRISENAPDRLAVANG